jgi:hypothetical protein
MYYAQDFIEDYIFDAVRILYSEDSDNEDDVVEAEEQVRTQSPA